MNRVVKSCCLQAKYVVLANQIDKTGHFAASKNTERN
jgi:hypothetical protein